MTPQPPSFDQRLRQAVLNCASELVSFGAKWVAKSHGFTETDASIMCAKLARQGLLTEFQRDGESWFKARFEQPASKPMPKRLLMSGFPAFD